MNKIIVVDHSEIVTGAKGEYLKVTTKDGKINNIFDQGLWNLFNDGLAVELSLEKEGNWWNVKGAKAVGIPAPVTTQTPPPQIDEPTKTNPIQKDIRENMEWKANQIERSLWWKEIGEHIRVGTLKRKTSEGKPDLVGTAYILAYWAEAARVLGIKVEKVE